MREAPFFCYVLCLREKEEEEEKKKNTSQVKIHPPIKLVLSTESFDYAVDVNGIIKISVLVYFMLYLFSNETI